MEITPPRNRFCVAFALAMALGCGYFSHGTVFQSLGLFLAGSNFTFSIVFFLLGYEDHLERIKMKSLRETIEKFLERRDRIRNTDHAGLKNNAKLN